MPDLDVLGQIEAQLLLRHYAEASEDDMVTCICRGGLCPRNGTCPPDRHSDYEDDPEPYDPKEWPYK